MSAAQKKGCGCGALVLSAGFLVLLVLVALFFSFRKGVPGAGRNKGAAENTRGDQLSRQPVLD